MKRYAKIDNNAILYIIESETIPDSIFGNWIECGSASAGWAFDGISFSKNAITNPTEFLIDVGPFFDRFKTSKMPILMSTNATVKAIVSDLQVRKWVDLKRSDVAQGIDVLIALNVSGVAAALKNDILNLPVTPDENLALRKLYFS